MPDRETLRTRTVDEVRSLLAKPLKRGYMEVTIVGDLDPETVLALAAKTLGTLPPRQDVKPRMNKNGTCVSPRRRKYKISAFLQKQCGDGRRRLPTADGRNYARSIQLEY